jgi:PilZ domain
MVSKMLFVPAKAPRRSPRQWIAVPVRIRAGELRVDGVTINVSAHGMYLFAAANLAVGIQIEIAYRPPRASKTVCACGIVRRRAVFLYGIEFLTDDTAPVEIPRYIYEELS